MPGAARALRIEPSYKRVRTYLAGQLVADTLRPVLVWEGPPYPVYYLPPADIRAAPAPHSLRDRPAAPVLPAPHRPADGPAPAVGCRVRLPVQGDRQLLVGEHRAG